MNWGLTRSFEEDLALVDKYYRNSLRPWWGEVEKHHQRLEEDTAFMVLPALAISVFRDMGNSRDTSLTIGHIIKLICLSNFIHEEVKDDDEGQTQDSEMQFSILIGDYILGQVLDIIIDQQLDSLIKMFAEMMAAVSQGLTEKYKMDLDWQEVVERSRLPLYRTVFQAAGRVAGAGSNTEVWLDSLGYNLGMAVELGKDLRFREEARRFAGRAEEMFQLKNDRAKSSVYAILKGWQEALASAEQAAAI